MSALREPDALAVYVKGCKDATAVGVTVMRMSEFSGGEEDLFNSFWFLFA